MSKKPAIIGLGIFVVLVIIALIIYLFTRSSKSTETEDLPTVKDAGIELVLNPVDKTDKVEEYSIFTTEYAIGETTAKNIDIKLTWTNGPTFASVESLIFVHKANGNSVRENVKTVDNIQSNETNELIFDGEQLTNENIVGDNTIDMYWNEVKESNKLTTISFKITQEHLDTTLNLDNASTIDIPVQLSSSSIASGDVIAEYTKYRILPFFTDLVHIRKTSANDKGFHVLKDNVKQEIDDVDTFYIVKALGKDFISKDASGNNILNGDTKKFVSKNDIFGDVNIMNSSAISLEEIKVSESCEPLEFVLVIREQEDEKYLSHYEYGNISGISFKDDIDKASTLKLIVSEIGGEPYYEFKVKGKERWISTSSLHEQYKSYAGRQRTSLSAWVSRFGDDWTSSHSLKCIKTGKETPVKEIESLLESIKEIRNE